MAAFSDALQIVYKAEYASKALQEQYAKYYRVALKRIDAKACKLCYWCFCPGVAMLQLKEREGVRNFILTSGTLAPLKSLEIELLLKFPVQLENSHVIPRKSVFLGIIPNGPGRISLNSSFKNRDLPFYKAELGEAILRLCQCIPSGILVFFPSYQLMESLVALWKATGRIWLRIGQEKKIFVEPKDSQEFGAQIQQYYEAAAAGAIFFAVCRGKAAEGVDFRDARARAVIITGLPFPAVTEPQVVLKRSFLDEAANAQLSGSIWYSQQATRAINQAIGRLLRHKDDWGAILLCDNRFLEARHLENLPFWLRGCERRFDCFDDAIGQLNSFFYAQAHCKDAEPESTENFVFPEWLSTAARSPAEKISLFERLKYGKKEICHEAPANHAEEYLSLAQSLLSLDQFAAYELLFSGYLTGSGNQSSVLLEIYQFLSSNGKHHLFEKLAACVKSADAAFYRSLKAAHQQGATTAKRSVEQETENCFVCKAAAKNAHISQCGHICCHACWCEWIAKWLECPACGACARIKYLKKL